jgi:hypothetical protein
VIRNPLVARCTLARPQGFPSHPDSDKCLDAIRDCQSLVCINNVCQNAGCTDGVMNGGETDVDCEGRNLPKVPNGLPPFFIAALARRSSYPTSALKLASARRER